MDLLTTSSLYWITRCDNFIGVSVGLGIFALFFGLIAFAFFHDTDHPICACFTGVLSLLLVLQAFLVCAFLPSTKEMAAILVVPRIANSQTVQELGGEVVSLAREWLAELHPKKSEIKKQ